MTPSKSLWYCCLSFIAGIAARSFFEIPQYCLWGFLIAGASLVVGYFIYQKPVLAIVGFCLFAVVLGTARLQIAVFGASQDRLQALNDQPEKVIITGQIIAEPVVKSSSQILRVKTGQSLVLVTVARYPEYHYLDAVQITGKLQKPQAFGDFDYKNYLAKEGIYSVMSFPAVTVVSTKHSYNPLTFTYEKILWLKGKLMASLDDNFSPPGNAIMQGIVFGNDALMPQSVKDKFNATGLSHLTAVSGSNIVIIIEMLVIFLLALGLWRHQAFYFAVALIWLYIVLIGFPISGVRAAIMGSVGLLASKLGRQNTSSRVLVATAAVLLLQNPMLLRYDVSFQLSFLASMGIIWVKPLVDYGLQKIRLANIPLFSDILSVTLAAQAFALPVMAYNFGTVSLVSPVTNVLVLPMIPFLTIAGFLVSVAGTFSHWLSLITAFPCVIALIYFIKILDLFSGPWAVKTVQNISWLWFALYYIIAGAGIWYFERQKKPDFLGY